MSRGVTLADIAAAAGVSKSTVSVALNDRSGVGAGQRSRIQAVARSLGYRPDPGLRALADYRWPGGRRGGANIAVLGTPDAPGSNSFHDDLMQGAREACDGLGYAVLLPPAAARRDRATMTEQLLRRGVRGILLLGPAERTVVQPTPDWAPFSVLQIESRGEGDRFDQVRLDFAGDAERALDRVLAAGHRRVGVMCIGEQPEPQVDAHRLAALDHIVRRERINRGRLPVFRGSPGDRRGGAAWLEREQPTAVIDFTQSFRPHVLAIPDTAYVSLHVRPEETTISGLVVESDRIGREAVHQLDLLIRRGRTGESELPRITLITSAWRDGETLTPR